jgi:toxin ParE1/3/4
MSVLWHVRLAARAELDFLELANWTAQNFGPRQAEAYLETITLALEALHDGPEIIGVKARDDEIGSGIRTLHVAREGRRGRHFVVFREARGQIIDVLRILHDGMDLVRHLGEAEDQAD